MRAGTGTPFGKTLYPLHLFSGGTFLMPPGNFIVDVGRVSIIQTFDNQNYIWRTVAGPSQKYLVSDSDGVNFRIVNFSGVVSGALITNAGTGGTNGIGPTQTSCSISFGAAPTAGRAAKGYVIVGGSINTTITITAAGTGYLVPPLLVIDPPPRGGIQATAYCTLSSGTIGAVVVTNPGAGYLTAPNVTIVPQFAAYTASDLTDPAGNTIVTAPKYYPAVTPYSTANTSVNPASLPIVLDSISQDIVGAGSGGVLTVNSTLGGDGTVTGIVITDYGSNYLGTGIPTITFTGGPTSAAATAIMAFSCTSVTVSNAGAAVSVAPPWRSSVGLVAATDGNSGYYQIRPASGVSTLSSTTTTILTSNTVEDPGFGIQKVPVVGYTPAGGTAWTTNPAGTAVMGGIADTCLIQRAGS